MKALVVDDSDAVRGILATHLAQTGFDVDVAADGFQAVSRAGQSPPDVVLLDWDMPGMDGLEVLRRLRANPQTSIVPVVILTSSKEDRDRANGYYGGANSYVQKPVDFSSFVDAVRQLGMYWLMLNEPPPIRPAGA